jgi:hypothetical protein
MPRMEPFVSLALFITSCLNPANDVDGESEAIPRTVLLMLVFTLLLAVADAVNPECPNVVFVIDDEAERRALIPLYILYLVLVRFAVGVRIGSGEEREKYEGYTCKMALCGGGKSLDRSRSSSTLSVSGRRFTCDPLREREEVK